MRSVLPAILARLAEIFAELAVVFARLGDVAAALAPAHLDELVHEGREAVEALRVRLPFERDEVGADVGELVVRDALPCAVTLIIAEVAHVVVAVANVIARLKARPARRHVAPNFAAVGRELPMVAADLRALLCELAVALAQLRVDLCDDRGLNRGDLVRRSRGPCRLKVRTKLPKVSDIASVIHALSSIRAQLLLVLRALDTVSADLSVRGTSGEGDDDGKNGNPHGCSSVVEGRTPAARRSCGQLFPEGGATSYAVRHVRDALAPAAFAELVKGGYVGVD